MVMDLCSDAEPARLTAEILGKTLNEL